MWLEHGAASICSYKTLRGGSCTSVFDKYWDKKSGKLSKESDNIHTKAKALLIETVREPLFQMHGTLEEGKEICKSFPD